MKIVAHWPMSLKNMWSHVAEYHGINFNVHGKFKNITIPLRQFRTAIQNYTGGELVSIMNETSFPSGRCPSGCSMYVDTHGYIPYNHLLNYYCPGFTACQANGLLFQGKRPDWPDWSYNFAFFRIKPVLTIDKEKGLCVVVCENHKDTSFKYVYPPINPILVTQHIHQPDLRDEHGQIIVSSQFLKYGNYNSMSCSFPTLKYYSTMQGSNAISIAPNMLGVNMDKHKIPPTFLEEFLCFHFRSDIKIFSRVNEAVPIDYYEKLEQCWKFYYNRQAIENSKVYCSLGTFVTNRDAVETALQYNDNCKRNIKENKTNPLMTYCPSNSKFLPKVLHSVSAREEKIPVVITVFFYLQNSTVLRVDALQFAEAQPGRQDLKYLLNNTESTNMYHNASLMRKILGLYQNLLNEGEKNRQTNHQVCLFLSKLYPDVNINDCTEVDMFNVMVEGDYHLNFTEEEDGLRFPDEVNDYRKVIQTTTVWQDGISVMRFDIRYEIDLHWQSIVVRNGKISTVDGVSELAKVCLYVHKDRLHGRINRTQFNFAGVQYFLMCVHHQERHLKRALKDNKLKCGKLADGRRCGNKIYYVCDNNGTCPIGLCHKHFDEVYLDRREKTLIDSRGYLANDNAEVDASEDVTAQIQLADTNYNHERDPLVDLYNDNLEAVDPVPLATNVTSTPTLREEYGSEYVSGHYLMRSILFQDQTVQNRQGKIPIPAQRFLQKLYTLNPGEPLPINDFEGKAFPKIFFTEHNNCIIGSLPAIMFTSYGTQSLKGGLASLWDHVKVRLQDVMSLTSRDWNYIAFLFDALYNICLINQCPLTSARRGFEHTNRAALKGRTRVGIKTEYNESDYEARKIAASFYDVRNWTYFVNLTCNTGMTPGVAPIIKVIKLFCGNDHKKAEYMIQNAMPIILRSWRRFIFYLFEYLVNSPEQPLGDIETYHYRFEFQSSGAKGNVPHVHAGVTLKEGEDEKITMNRIVMNPPEFIKPNLKTTYNEALRVGLVKNWREWLQIVELIEKASEHGCSEANERCQKKKVDGSVRCRVPLHPNSLIHTKEKKDIYSTDIKQALSEMGIYEPYPDILQAVIYHYHNLGYRKSLPIVPLLAMICRSSTNIQMAGYKFAIAYLVKYVCGVDEKRDVWINLKPDDKIEIDYSKGLHNEKINSARFAYAKEKLKTQSTEPLTKEVPITEMMWFMLDLEYSCTNVIYVSVNCRPFEHRGAIFKRSQNVYTRVFGPDNELLTVTLRQDLPVWRQFKDNVVVHIQETVFGHYVADVMCRYNMRAPELIIIDNVHDYAQWFVIEEAASIQFEAAIDAKPLLDGLGNVVRCRQKYLPKLVLFLDDRLAKENLAPTPNRVTVVVMSALYRSLLLESERKEPEAPYSERYKRFVNEKKTSHVSVVFNESKPEMAESFLANFATRHGSYACELDLYGHGNIRDAYERAGLIPDANNVRMADIYNLHRTYLMKELAFSPRTNQAMERNFRLALDVFRRALHLREDAIAGNPYILNDAIQAKAEDNLLEMETNSIRNLIPVIQSYNFPDCPTEDEFLEGRDVPFVPRLEPIPNQSAESFQEQRKALTICRNAIESYMDVHTKYVRSIILEGPPGSGKTYLMMLIAAYAITKNIKFCIMSLTAQRSRMLGSVHMHHLFCMPVTDDGIFNAPLQVEGTLKALLNQPTKYAYLKRLNFLFFEEIGLISKEQLCVIDQVMRRIKVNNKPFGGCVLIATGDHQQLKPITGSYVWLSSQMVTTFKIVKLQHFVRSAGDPDLQRIISIIRKGKPTRPEVRDVLAILERRCKNNNVLQWFQVPDGIMRLVSKKAAEKQVTDDYVTRKKSEQGATYIESAAKDEARLITEGNWQEASEDLSRELDRKCLSRRDLIILKNSVMSLTYNNNTARPNLPIFSQGQLVVIKEIPPTDNEPLIGKLIPVNEHFNGNFEEIPQNWPRIVIRRANSATYSLGERKTRLVRRNQFPLRYHVCNTIHKAMGDTINRIATRISNVDDNYALWEKAQLLVVISRIRSLDNLTFVGPWNENMNGIRCLLNKQNLISDYVTQRINSLNVIGDPIALYVPQFQRKIGFCSQVPYEECGFVYMFVSAQNDNVNIIEQCHCIRHDLNFYNSAAALAESGPYRPFLVAFYITGFPNNDGADPRNIYARNRFLNELDQKRIEDNLAYTAAGINYGWAEIIQTAANLLIDYRDPNNLEMRLTMTVTLCDGTNVPNDNPQMRAPLLRQP